MKILKAVFSILAVLVVFSSVSARALTDTSSYRPPPTIDPTPVSFPRTEAGTISGAVDVTVWTNTSHWVYVDYFGILDGTNFALTSLTPSRVCRGYVSFYCDARAYFQPQRPHYYETALLLDIKGYRDVYDTVSGTGYVPSLEPSPASIDYGAVPINTTDTRVVTLTNNALIPIAVSSLSIPLGASFGVDDVCVTTIPAGGACNMAVSFSPTSVRTYTSALTVRDEFGNDFNINLAGSGIEELPDITLSTEEIDFGSQTIGTPSAPSPVTIVSSGLGNLQIRNIESSSDAFTITDANDCAHATLSTGQTCTFTITFTPTEAVDYDETVAIENNVPTKDPKYVSVLGVGKEPGRPAVDLSVNRYDFGAVYVGETSPNYPVTFVNVGEADLVVENITASDGFGVDVGACIGTFAPAGSCTFQMHFAPTEAKDYNEGAITLVDNAPDPGRVTVYGVGINHDGPAIDLSVGSHDFGDQTVGTVSAPFSITLRSVGDLPLTITEIAPSGDFTLSGDCVGTFAPGSSCVIFTTFAPTEAGARTGAITITDDAVDSPQSISLSGTGVVPEGPVVELSPDSLNFGPQTIGTKGEMLSVVLQNVGGQDLTITSVEIDGQFSQENDCVGTVVPAGRCGIAVTFSPTVLGDLTGTVTITDNASGSPHTVYLEGVGMPALTPVASLSTNAIDFGYQAVNTSATQTLTLTNTGDSDLSIQLTTIDGEGAAAYSRRDGCHGAVVEAGTSCTIEITFMPTELEAYSATLSIADDAADSPQLVAITGNGGSSSSSGCDLMLGGNGQPLELAAVVIAVGLIYIVRRKRTGRT